MMMASWSKCYQSIVLVIACIFVACTAFSVPKHNSNYNNYCYDNDDNNNNNDHQHRLCGDSSFVNTGTIHRGGRYNKKCYSTSRTITSPIASTTTTTSLKSSASSSISPNEDLLPGISVIDDANTAIAETMENLQGSPYFRLFCVDILASCEYMPQELFECYSETCEVYPVDDDMVPENIRGDDYLDHDFELDGWARWDMPSNDYYDLGEFPDSYTGYDGSEIWEFIHRKICFDGYNYNDGNWKADFNKAVSGMHSLISAQVTKGIQDKIDAGEDFTDAEVWRDPAVEFNRRLSEDGDEPMAMENLYFSYMLFLSAAAMAKDRLLAECESGDKIDEGSAAILRGFLSLPVLNDPAVMVASRKLRDDATRSSNEPLWEARMRTRDLLRVMNCVQCNKCRLHGKIAMLGMSTALQIHLGRNGEGGDLNQVNRTELAALLSTIYKFSKAVEFFKKWR